MKFNSKKFQYINFSIHPEDKGSNVYVGPDLNLINASKSVKDLGVTMSNDCMFDQHIHNVVKKSSQLCGWILRTFQTRSEVLMLTLFKSIVLSKIDYFPQLWTPYKKGYVCELERMQRSFTKYISGKQNLSHHQRLNALRLYYLQRRRDRYIVIYMWKILENLMPSLTPKVQIYTSDRRCRLCYTQHVPIGHIGTLCFNSLRWKALRLFNSFTS